MASVRIWVLRVVALALVWVALTDSRNPQELILGTAVVIVVVAALSLFARPPATESLARLAVPARVGARRLARPIWLLFRDSAAVSALVVRAVTGGRPIRGAFKAADYHPGRERRGVGGTVLTEVLGSLAPARYVVGIDGERSTILVHELDPASGSADALER